jgi:hypothetical protein
MKIATQPSSRTMYNKSMKAAVYFKHGDTKVASVIDNYSVPRVRKGQLLGRYCLPASTHATRS